MIECNGNEVRSVAGKAYGASDLPEAELRRLLNDPDGLLWRNLHSFNNRGPVKIDHNGLMVKAELILGEHALAAAPVQVAYKQYRCRNAWKSLCSLFRRSRARRAWHASHGLLARQIATPRPLAMCELRRGWLFTRRRESYLATEWIEAAENLHLAGWRWADQPGHRRLRWAARCATSLGRLIGRMHAAGVAHRDLKGANLLVVGQGDRLATYLVDVDAVRIGRRVGRSRRAANLARLAVAVEAHPWLTRTVCCRFVRAYCDQFPSGQIDWKPLWRDVAARSRRIVRRKRRRGKQVL